MFIKPQLWSLSCLWNQSRISQWPWAVVWSKSELEGPKCQENSIYLSEDSSGPLTEFQLFGLSQTPFQVFWFILQS